MKYIRMYCINIRGSSHYYLLIKKRNSQLPNEYSTAIVSVEVREVLRCSTHLSRVAARMYLPLGENLTKDTGGLSSSIGNNERVYHPGATTLMFLFIDKV